MFRKRIGGCVLCTERTYQKVVFWKGGELNLGNASFQMKTEKGKSMPRLPNPFAASFDLLDTLNTTLQIQVVGDACLVVLEKLVTENNVYNAILPTHLLQIGQNVSLEYLTWDSGWSITITMTLFIGLIIYRHLIYSILHIYLRRKHKIAGSIYSTMEVIILTSHCLIPTPLLLSCMA